jgi:UDPglucose 6-dehydrogenase
MGLTISVIGLGKLGASMAAAFASRGFKVIGVDVDHRAVDAINDGRAPVQETGLQEMMNQHRERLRATVKHEEAIAQSDLSFVVVPTPSDHRGAFSLQYAGFAFKQIGRALARKNTYHLVVLTSTVLPGSTRYGLLPILEKESGKKCGVDFGLCYSPEFIALGTVLRDFLHPDFFLIGEFDKRSGDLLQSINDFVCLNKAPSRRMSIENAELAKIALNSFVTMKISFANMLKEMCERLPGGDVDAVTSALGLDKRIGRKCLTGGLGFGGPCFPRDNLAFGFMARQLGVNADLPSATDRVNRSVALSIVEKLRPSLRRGTTAAVLGLAYKPLSNVVEESQGIFLARALADAGLRVLAYDPMANGHASKALEDHALILDSIEGCVREADIVLITTPDPIFQSLTAKDLLGEKTRVAVFDFWRLLKEELFDKEGIDYFAGGHCWEASSSETKLRALWATSFEPSDPAPSCAFTAGTKTSAEKTRGALVHRVQDGSEGLRTQIRS